MGSAGIPPPPRRTHLAPVSRISRGAALLRTGFVTLTVVLVIFAGLTLQMALGDDPALGSRVDPTGARASVSATAASQTSAVPATSTQIPTQTAPAQVPIPTPVQTSTS